MISDMDTMFSCFFNLCDVRMRIAITCVVPRGYFRGSSLKMKSVSGDSFIRGKSVKKELIYVWLYCQFAFLRACSFSSSGSVACATQMSGTFDCWWTSGFFTVR